MSLAVLVMTPPGVDFDYPHAQVYLTDVVSQAIARYVEGVEFVGAQEIDRFQRDDLDWLRLSVGELGEKFGVDRIVYLDVVQYTTTEENSVNLLRGRIWAEVSVYEMDAEEVDDPVYTGEVMMVFPEHAPVPLNSRAQQQIEMQTISLFGEAMAKKFYDHEMDWDKAQRARKEKMRK